MWGWLACDNGGSVTDELTEKQPSQASKLPQGFAVLVGLWFCAAGLEEFAQHCPALLGQHAPFK
jgi:hypothetical protein